MMTLTFVFAISAHSQNVVLKGNVFEQVQSNKTKKEPTKTSYEYKVGDSIYAVYLSSSGKAFILKRSKKTGKQYRQYLPKVTEKLSKLKK